jgi:dTDP-4-amino-4,6-dideoxygalactose transaminase
MINVTKPFFPPIEEYFFQVKRIWENQWLTNRGKLTLELEEKLKSYLTVNNILVVNNGTIPLQIALKLLGGNGEIITTPFSYVATTSTILWENCKPVFVDIDPEFLTIDENKIEQAINGRTTAILATHVFGNPCNIEAIEKIAKKHNLKVIYDAAHCFGVKYKGKSIFEYGDISTCSFHATKIFHTGEGGAIFSNNKELMHKIYYSHNFGHDGPSNFFGLGINAKISELQSSMGLAILPHIDDILKKRKIQVETYLEKLDNKKLSFIKIRPESIWNYSYFPIIFDTEANMIKTQTELNNQSVYPRRYFFPSLNIIPFVNGESCPKSEDITKRILCLPLFDSLSLEDIDFIIKIINNI